MEPARWFTPLGAQHKAVTGPYRMSLHHSPLNSARLVVLLQQWNKAERAREESTNVAEQLGQWLGTVGSVKLSRALHAIESLPQDPTGPGATPDLLALDRAFQATRTEVIHLIRAPVVPPRPARERADNTRVAEPDPREGADFSALAPRYLMLQKQMETRLNSLRAQLRSALSNGSSSQKQLAALDVVMEQMLGEREQRLWALLPAQLDKRLTDLRSAHERALEQSGHADEPQRWRKAGGWLWAFEQDLQALLLAEMQVRLQPIMGLLQALQAAPNKHNGLTG